jgi:glycosyltransferase involved in cell wall biosynthesis
LRGYDLILSSSHCVAKGVVPRNALHIAYIHAPMRYVWDQYDAYFKDAGALSRFGMKIFRRYLQSWDVRSSQRVDHFIANSNNVAAKIRSFYNRECATIYPPVELDRFDETSNGRDYYLVVSALVPYKRVDLAIQACNELRVPLKIVGDGPLRKSLEKQGGPQVEFIGHVDDRRLAELYSGSRALLFPGEEDFGIVAVEAQASGRPVIAFGKGGALETVRPFNADFPAPFSTGIFFHELTAASLMDAMCRFEKHIDVFDPAAIRAHAGKFSRTEFKRCIEQFIAEKIAERK